MPNDGSSTSASKRTTRARTRTCAPCGDACRRGSPLVVLEPGVDDLGACRRPRARPRRARPRPARSAAAEVQLEVAAPPTSLGLADHDDVARARAASRGRRSADRRHVVRDEQDRAALVAQAVELVEALLLEGGVADREHLVDQQHVGVDLDHHREREPHVHARRVVLELEVLELAQLGELDDALVALARLARA